VNESTSTPTVVVADAVSARNRWQKCNIVLSTATSSSKSQGIRRGVHHWAMNGERFVVPTMKNDHYHPPLQLQQQQRQQQQSNINRMWKRTIFIQTENTPNPESIKFVPTNVVRVYIYYRFCMVPVCVCVVDRN
jgi:hypothetical protein